MLLQFNATNFGAFRDTFSLNMTPAKITEFPDSLITDTDDVSAIPLAGFYGANGSGKSTVLKALHYLSRCILSPSQALPEDHRFAFGHEAADAVTEFEVLFRAGRMEYDYQLRLLPGTVLEENLFARSFSDPSYDVVFDRDGEGVYLGALVDGVDVSSLEDDTPMLAFLIQQTRLSWLPAVSGFFEGISWLSCSAISEDVLTPYLSDTRAMKKLTGLICPSPTSTVKTGRFSACIQLESPRMPCRSLRKAAVYASFCFCAQSSSRNWLPAAFF